MRDCVQFLEYTMAQPTRARHYLRNDEPPTHPVRRCRDMLSVMLPDGGHTIFTLADDEKETV